MIPSASTLRDRVTLQRRASTLDALGQASTTWEEVATVWAQVQPLRGREYFAAGQMQSAVDVRIRIRWRDDVTPAMRALVGDVPHDIDAVIDPENLHEALELMCTRGVRDGREG